MSKNEVKAQEPVRQNVHGLMSFLQRFSPFSDMDESHLASFVTHCSLQYFADGDVVLEPGGKSVDQLYVVKQGRIRGERDTNQDGKIDTTFEISKGECFPMAALLGERPTRTLHRAVGDTFCLVLPREHFISVFGLSEVFRDFCLRGVSSLLDQVTRQMQSRSMESLGASHSLDTPLEHFATRSPITCTPEMPVHQAVARMHDENVGSVVITDSNKRPIGIFTLRDLRRLVAAPGQDLGVPIAQVMTGAPHTLPETASAFDAALAMAEHHFAHVCLINAQGQISGVVSERDLFSLQRVHLVHLARAIASATRLQTLVGLQAEIANLIQGMLARGAAAGQILRIITTLNDCTVRRVIELNLNKDDPGVTFTWLIFGSEARHEQTLLTDQDNGILFQCAPGQTEDQARAALLPLAKRINNDLAACGFSLCKGNIMASNPELCLSAQEWRQWYMRLIASSTPENLLRSSIFLDLRAVWGDVNPVESMFTEILSTARKNSLFQKMLATNALNNRVPLQLFRGFVFGRGPDKRRIDLKTQGLTPFVDAARVFALAHGIRATSTLERIESLTEAGVFDARDANAWTEAYGLIQLLRMQNQQRQVHEQKELNNRINIDSLNQLDRRILREALRQAQRLQQTLERAYPG
ncbi:MAG: cyclic nucleotide-binding protein [Alteromonadaceae bacterium]|nr:cyclic nucleotide-binding protein [Alteromonadaceae bacterium]